MRVSVVICTLNRAQSLGETLECLRYQNYPDLEVVVVNGPSTDNSEEVLRAWRGAIKHERCPVPNLSVSRNIGIRAASGDVVAFIDDDALPEFDWLLQAIPAFDDPEVAGVGGIVFDHTGVTLQYKFSASNRFGETAASLDLPFDDQCVPGSFQFPYLQGTNALFLRSALLHIGGFDETFDYYLDETDVCCRLVDAGYVLRQLPNAPVHHKFLPSGVRDHQRIVTHWSPIMKNQAYFSYRHALGDFTEYDIIERSREFMQTRIADAWFHESAGRLPAGSSNSAAVKCGEAMRIGMQLGWERRNLVLGPVHWPADAFHPFPQLDISARRKLTFVTSGYTGNLSGGIARLMADLAPALARRGHEVRVITQSSGQSTVDFESGVWVHRVATSGDVQDGVAPDAMRHIDAFATAAASELARIAEWSHHDLVFGPLWDVEVLGALRRVLAPVVVHIATPAAIAADMSGQLVDDNPDIAHLQELERLVMDDADLFQANTDAVLQTMRELYPGEFPEQRWQVAALGLADVAGRETAVTSADTDDVMVLFVGRFEVRKGIDLVLGAVENLAPRFPHVRFVVAGEDRPLGPGEPLVGESWRARHRNASWMARVEFPGSVDDDELHDLYAAADIALLPSRYESFGLVMVEAQMHGVAVVSSDCSGIPAVVRQAVDGLLVPPGDQTALDEAVERLIDDGDLRRRLGANGRERFVSEFDVERFADRFEALFGRVELIGVEAGTVSGPHDWTRREGRHPALLAHAGCRFRAGNAAADAVTTLLVQPNQASVLRVGASLFALTGGDVVRVPITPAVPVEIVSGEVVVAGCIVVDGASR